MNILGSFAANGVGLMKSYTPKLEKLEAEAAQTIRIRADKDVVLATGGFISNRDMVSTYLPKYKGAMMNGAPGCDGSGIRFGESVGGATRMMDHASVWRVINPPLACAQIGF
jgi:3-oxo-5alpha-steroid 4-dehydrogenase